LTQPNLNVAAIGRREPDARPSGIVAAPPSVSPKPEQASAGDPAEKAGASDSRTQTVTSSTEASRSAPLNPDLVQLGDQFAGLTRLLDDIKLLGKGLPTSDVDAMMKPIFGVLKGIMNRIVAAPATTIADLGIKAQVVKWGNRDWWHPNATLGWEAMTAKVFIEQTIAAATSLLPQASAPTRTEESTSDPIDSDIGQALAAVRPFSKQRG